MSPANFFEDFFSVIKYIAHFLKMSITFVKEFVLPLTLFSLDYKPHVYIGKLGFTGVYIIFLISVQNIDCGYSLEPPR